jgi:hypothetical protein|tara:strand:+ start:1797 stop:2201 length:405 start_codon:yes stop_codon:yes gene_type:complete
MGHPKKKEQKRTTLNKETLIKALENNMGNVTLACHFSGVARSTFYRYYDTDSEFKKQVDDIENMAIDVCEAELWKLIKDGNSTAIIFFLKTKGKKRGYVERQELTGQDGTPIVWNETKTYKETNGAINKTNSSN